MNLIYIHTHDSGRVLPPYDYIDSAPALQSLAQESIVFHRAFCAGPTCSPSRAGLLLGQAPHCTGMLGLAHRGFVLDHPEQHLSNYLAENGYHCALIGVQHEMPRNRTKELGYHEVIWNPLPTPHQTDIAHLDAALAFLSRRSTEAKPFFLSFGMRCTHREYPALTFEEEKEAQTLVPPYPQPDLPQVRTDFRAYQKSLETVDLCVSRLMEKLKKTGLAENTIVLFTTDHGIAFPNMKCTLYDSGMGVALMLRHPHLAPAHCNALFSQIDVYPTLCDMLGLPKPKYLQGKSFWQEMQNPATLTAEGNAFVFSEVTFHAAFEPMRAVRSKNYKLIRYYSAARMRLPANIDDSPSKDLFWATPAAQEFRPQEEFFDLVTDPGEQNNLISNPDYCEEIARHRNALDSWMQRTNDPLLQTLDPAVIAPGALVNLPADYSPKTKPQSLN